VLDGPAASTTSISLNSSRPTYALVPTTVQIKKGFTKAQFDLHHSGIQGNYVVNVSADYLGRDVEKSVLLADQLPVGIAPIPAALGWDQSRYPIYPVLSNPGADGRFTGSLGPGSYSPLEHPDLALAARGPAYYVDAAIGDDRNSGLPLAPFASIGQAQWALNLGGRPGRIYVRGGQEYDRLRNFNAGLFLSPAVHTIYIAHGGRVKVSTRESALDGWQPSPLYPTCQVHLGSLPLAPARVLNPLTRDAWGLVMDMVSTSSLLVCSLTPNSWYYREGDGKLFVNRADGLKVSNENTTILSQEPNFVYGGNVPCSVALVGATAQDGFDLEGGARDRASSAFQYHVPSVVLSGNALIYAKNCTFRYAGFYADRQNCNGVGLNSLPGLAFFEECDASGNGADGFNVHDTRANQPRLLTLNCTAYRNGQPGSISSNAWTTHHGVVGIDIGGRYGGSAGFNLHSIDKSRSLLIGTASRSSRGDIAHGGSFAPGEFCVSGAATYWCYWTQAHPTLERDFTYIANVTDARIFRRDAVHTWGRTLPVVPSGTIVDFPAQSEIWR
jgi:hypothetical protein